jgi:hypothetical protein
MVVDVTRSNLPVNYVNAFITPVRPSAERSLVTVSAERLGAYMGSVARVYGVRGDRAFIALEACQLPLAQRLSSLVELRAWVVERLPQG